MRTHAWLLLVKHAAILPLIVAVTVLTARLMAVPDVWLFAGLGVTLTGLAVMGSVAHRRYTGLWLAGYILIFFIHWLGRLSGAPLPEYVWFINHIIFYTLGHVLLARPKLWRWYHPALAWPIYIGSLVILITGMVCFAHQPMLLGILITKALMLASAAPFFLAAPTLLHTGLASAALTLQMGTVVMVALTLWQPDLGTVPADPFSVLLVLPSAFIACALLGGDRSDRRLPAVLPTTTMLAFAAALLDRSVWVSMPNPSYLAAIAGMGLVFLVVTGFALACQRAVSLATREQLFRFGRVLNEIAIGSEDPGDQLNGTFRTAQVFSPGLCGFELQVGLSQPLLTGRRGKIARILRYRQTAVTGTAWFETPPDQGYEMIEPTLILHLERLRREIIAKRLSRHDPLTGLLNRNGLMAALKRLSHRSPHQCCAVLLLDIDRFKLVNDQLGHDVGDRVLIQIAELLASAVRPEDIVARWGGEEMIIIFPGLGEDIETTRRVTERVFQQTSGKILAAPDWPITWSGGVAVGPFHAFESLVIQADEGLYTAKAEGRNQIVYLTDTGASLVQQDAPPFS